MIFLLLLPTALSAVLLAAHFLRFGHLELVALALAIPLVLALIPRRWALRALQLYLVLAAIEWIFTMVAIISDRRAGNEPFTAAAIILMSVAAFTLFSAILLELPSARARFRARQ